MKFASCSAWSFGKTNKCILEKTDLLTNPGPGSYQPGLNSNKAPMWK
jgi:hypothetical protein